MGKEQWVAGRVRYEDKWKGMVEEGNWKPWKDPVAKIWSKLRVQHSISSCENPIYNYYNLQCSGDAIIYTGISHHSRA